MYSAIDIHAHFGDPSCFPQKGLEKEFMRLDLEHLKREYDRQMITAACISPMEAIFPADERALLRANDNMAELARKNDWFYQWVVVDPLLPASYRQAEALLPERKCVGVKIHPDAHGYAIRDRGDEIFAFCREQGAVLETHSGEAMSMPEELVPFADRYPTVKVIAAHLGCGSDGCIEHQVRAIRAAKHGNIYTDVSSARSILNYIVEWAVEQVTADKLLFGTDTPLHHVAMMKQRIEYANISEPAKAAIFCGNALGLLGDKVNPSGQPQGKPDWLLKAR